MRIAIVALGSRGDVQPHIALGAGLRATGYDVCMVTHALFEPLIRRLELGFSPVEINPRDVVENEMGQAWLGSGSYNRLTYRLSTRIFWRLIRPSINMARQKILNLPPLFSNWLYEQIQQQRFPLLYYFSPSVLPQPPDWSNKSHVTGYWFLDDDPDWRPPADLLDFLSSGPAPVYVGFGSMRSPKSGEMTNLVLQALASTRQRGILVTGWGGISNVDLPEEVYKIDFAPHNWLFPQMVAVVHHGGAGTMAASVRAGVPTVMIPFFGDQPFWGRRYFALGILPKPIPHNHLTVQRLAHAIQIATSDEAIHTRLVELNERMRTENGVARAIEILEKSSWSSWMR